MASNVRRIAVIGLARHCFERLEVIGKVKNRFALAGVFLWQRHIADRVFRRLARRVQKCLAVGAERQFNGGEPGGNILIFSNGAAGRSSWRLRFFTCVSRSRMMPGSMDCADDFFCFSSTLR